MSGSLQLRHNGSPPPSTWEQAVASKLARLARRAARPARGEIHADADAVIFDDRAQLLACMASDWCEGTFHMRWWWQSLFKEAALARLLLPVWLDAPEYIPAALEYLSREQKIGPFIRALSANDARSLLQSITRSFALDELRPALLALTGEEGEAARDMITTASLDLLRQDVRSDTHSHSELLPPWQRRLPESCITDISLESQCLLGIGLMLARAPAVVRAPSFARDLKRWLEAATRAQPLATADLSGAVADPMHARVGVAAQISSASRQDRPAHLSAEHEQAGQDEARLSAQALSMPETEQRTSSSKQHDASALPWAGKAKSRRERVPRETTPKSAAKGESASETQSAPTFNREPCQSKEDDERRATGERVSPATVEDAVPVSTALASVPFEETKYEPALLEPLLEGRLETQMGGIFYLINVGLFLNLYGDFTTPAQAGIPLSLWDFLALLGGRLCGEKIRSDAVWSLLARLAGRKEQAEPGNFFLPPREWRLPAEWLVPFPEASICEWMTGRARLRVRHAQGFWILDLPLNASDPEGQLQLEMKAYAPHASLELQPGTWALLEDSSGPLESWLSWLASYVQARLARALRLAGQDAVSKLLCEHPARIFVTATHLDIVFELAQLPIEVRLSGLDRNPGWVPAAGRFIAFHYD